MPAGWSNDDFKEGGRKGIKLMDAVLDGIDDDVEGQFGTQIVKHFSNVEIIESTDPVVLEDGTLTEWVKQSGKKNSVNHKMVEEWAAFAEANNLGAIPGSLMKTPLRWERKVFEFGENRQTGETMTGSAFVPVGFPGGKKEVATVELPDELVAAVKAAISDDGATKDIIRRELLKGKAAIKNAVKDAGGLDVVLPSMVASGTLAVNDGYYTIPNGEEDL